MLSIGKLAAGGRTERYYTQSVAQGREDYYAGTGEAPGSWIGSGWLAEERDDPVSEADLRALLQGRHPVTGESVRRVMARGATGFDLTFSAPKSVSILYGIGEQEISAEVREAHDAATRNALDYLERHAGQSRRGAGGRQTIATEGFLAAAFRHRTSRAGDPQLHTHVVVANGVKGTDGRWGSLDARLLYRHAKTAGYLYQASLRKELTERLGVDWTPVAKGSAEIVGVPRPVIHHFSQRRAEITRHLAIRGQRSREAARVATLDTRRHKEYGVPVDRLRADWRARAAEHGFGRAEVADVLTRAERFAAVEIDVGRASAWLVSSDGVTKEASTFSRRDALQAWAEQHRRGGDVREIEQVADSWLDRAEVVQLAGRAGDAEPVFSTVDLLETERALIASAERRQARGVAVASRAAVEMALASRPTIGVEQADLVDRLVTGGDGVQVVRSAAGTGKTFALDAAREAWQAEGVTVFGCALSARAAAELRDSAAIESTTIARLKQDLDHGYGLREGSVLIVDEAGMVGTRDLAILAEHTERANAKLVLVGDDRQLPEIQAGGAFADLADRLGALELREVRRQTHEWDRKALLELRDGDVKSWANAYQDHGRISAASNAEQTRDSLVAAWHRDTMQRPEKEAVMVALRRRDVADLNDRARERLREHGQLDGNEVDVGGRALARGELIALTQNDRFLGVVNGDRGTVISIDAEQRSVTVTLADRQIELPARYLEKGAVDYGYATTAHRLQGATVDSTHVLGSDEQYREWGYTAMSRHRDQATFYVTSPQIQPTLPGLEKHDALDRTETRHLERSRAEETASSRGADPEKTLTPERLRESIPAEAYRLVRDDKQHDIAAKERAAAEERVRQTEQKLAEVGRFQRAQRDALAVRLESQRSAAERWNAEETRTRDQFAGSDFATRSWIEEHRVELQPLLGDFDDRSPAEVVRALSALEDCAEPVHEIEPQITEVSLEPEIGIDR